MKPSDKFADLVKTFMDGSQQTVREAKQFSQPGALLQRHPEDGPGRRELQEGQTRLIMETRDEVVLDEMPLVIRHKMERVGEENALFFRLCRPGHVRVWLRQGQIHADLGRWSYFEVQMPPQFLKYPNSKSFWFFQNTVLTIYSLAATMNPDLAWQFEQEMQKLLDPETKWMDEPILLDEEEEQEQAAKLKPPQKFTHRRLFYDWLEALGDAQSLGGGKMLLVRTGAALAAQALLSQARGQEWAGLFVELRLEFARRFTGGLICSTDHGIDYFDNVMAAWEGRLAWDEKGEYGANFRRMIDLDKGAVWPT